jgi:hypothetical protein
MFDDDETESKKGDQEHNGAILDSSLVDTSE